MPRYISAGFTIRRERRFEVGDLVLKKIFPSAAPGKFGPNWEGPYVVTTVHPENAYRIANSEGEE